MHYLQIKDLLSKVELSSVILDIMLGFLLFAGSLHTNWTSIKSRLKSITLFALGGVLLSTVLIAFLLYYLCSILGIQIDLLHCLIFGALISPTDPIAVLGILTKANVSKKVESTIVGESLFNDGVGVVLFVALLEIVKAGNSEMDFSLFGRLFVQEALGGLAYGMVLGFALHYLLKSIDNYETEVLLTLAFVMAGYTASFFLHISGALAMVVMGLLVGNYKRDKSMSDRTQEYVHKFWELVDVILNAVLFISIAFVMVVVDFQYLYFIVGVAAILIVLFSRVVIVYLPKYLLSKLTDLTGNEAIIVVWGGLRGGLSIALVLSLPDSPYKVILLVATYCCVVFSIIVHGLTIGKLAKHIGKKTILDNKSFCFLPK